MHVAWTYVNAGRLELEVVSVYVYIITQFGLVLALTLVQLATTFSNIHLFFISPPSGSAAPTPIPNQ